jgi:protein-disulfide isomerase-like protein with CxxC motif
MVRDIGRFYAGSLVVNLRRDSGFVYDSRPPSPAPSAAEEAHCDSPLDLSMIKDTILWGYIKKLRLIFLM